ncbi:tRNA(Ala)(adenine(37)) deaminase [Purpureocillium takamizusanense]|uniref:tRNA(Ala)(Adenine(37)) deaminase n=1 Tax=Purpureocillium takamizusanense TaxID=2060973 RepID=A0A9Q8QT57_9HYPO|nr:tRNA(Ala)(adenine(37)) deaminase [Purpureocillium takamizusanense]UNI24209.1 tRNA(Ala)(adenine(37)) deaminase [Purpureocillium takamizusanense]
MTSRADVIADAVITQFNKLPNKRKPAIRDNGLHEWVPLSGIVAEKDGTFTCVALATGMKCLPASRLPEANGNGIHDWHAEILAIRTFNRFLLDECKALSQGKAGTGSGMLVSCDSTPKASGSVARPPFYVKEGIKLHMYCSEAPCGDASMELIMAAQDDASPWPAPDRPSSPNAGGSDATLPGRAYFSQLGIVRRKPARGDAPPTLSKSCSDKLALKQCTSLLSSLAALLIDPAGAYIDTIVLPASQYSSTACERAFAAAGRMGAVTAREDWSDGYAFRPFVVETTTREFGFSRRAVQARAEGISPSNVAAAWALSGVEESILGGVVQGKRPFDPRGASRMSRRQMWVLARDVAGQLRGSDNIRHSLDGKSYHEVKHGPLLAARRAAKAATRSTALAGWVVNDGDSDFGADVET